MQTFKMVNVLSIPLEKRLSRASGTQGSNNQKNKGPKGSRDHRSINLQLNRYLEAYQQLKNHFRSTDQVLTKQALREEFDQRFKNIRSIQGFWSIMQLSVTSIASREMATCNLPTIQCVKELASRV